TPPVHRPVGRDPTPYPSAPPPTCHRRTPTHTAAEPHLSQATHGRSVHALRYKQQPNRICVRPPTDVPCTRSDTNSNRNASVSGHPRMFRARAPIQTAAEPHLFQATSADDDPLAKPPGVAHLRQARAVDLPGRGRAD